ncbi:TetR/AcrR family transcriptional regulator [Conexibacter stalactiti]|uniref:TetR/AcrR family transcriptional regulator n=1 Tax=Conexibacter stalactiti TaxID=1940611 RepID=A0ABU4HK14_9ACTN|nr:TetR/AcrR family transcriptional regulator [Conexibacter stalactiti]MDW5593032.1 TetR/AcrR family transcriptional regulator [Conexibacter stalactiti]MEC5033673.1 TetR/AcrR family transcriptional regulator [Conexibacter stalactiti]
MAAAAELVAEIGYERVTVDAIARRAKASKATMYRNWPTKAELIADALRRNADGGHVLVPDTGTLRTDLLATVEEIAQSFARDSGPSLLGLTEAIRQDAVLRDLVRSQIQARIREVGALILDRALARGDDVNSASYDMVLELAFGWLLTMTLLNGRMPDVDERTRLVDEAMLPLLRTASPDCPTEGNV